MKVRLVNSRFREAKNKNLTVYPIPVNEKQKKDREKADTDEMIDENKSINEYYKYQILSTQLQDPINK